MQITSGVPGTTPMPLKIARLGFCAISRRLPDKRKAIPCTAQTQMRENCFLNFLFAFSLFRRHFIFVVCVHARVLNLKEEALEGCPDTCVRLHVSGSRSLDNGMSGKTGSIRHDNIPAKAP